MDLPVDTPTLPPKHLWDVLYSLASVIFNLEIGRDKPNLIAPKTIFDTDKIIVEIEEIPKEEARQLIKGWLDSLVPPEHRQDIVKELVAEGYMTEDYEPLTRLNLLHDLIVGKVHKKREKPVVITKCPYCGKEFLKKDPKAVFCSRSCAKLFHRELVNHKLKEEYDQLKVKLSQMFAPEDVVWHAVDHMIEKYPFLSKVKRQELGIVRKRGKKKKEPQPIHATQPPPEKVEEEDPLEILKQILFGEDQKE